MDKAVELLRSKGAAKAEKRAGRQTKEGMIANYIHHNGKIAVLVELNCETDFVARTEDFQQLGKWIAEHVAAAAPLALDKDQVPQDKVESRAPHLHRAGEGRGQARAHDRQDRRGKDPGVLQGRRAAAPGVGARAEEDDRRSREGSVGQDGRERPGPPVRSVSARRVRRQRVTLPRRSPREGLLSLGWWLGRGGSNHPAARSIQYGFCRFNQRDLLASQHPLDRFFSANGRHRMTQVSRSRRAG